MGVVPSVEGFNILFEQFNRNKRGVAIDLRNDDGRNALDGLIEWADVFITSFLPAAREKLRLRTDDVWAINPRCIYAIGSGQGLQGPDAELGGFDAVSFWARGGMGHILTPEGAPLVMSRGAIGDAPSGAYLAGGIAAALVKLARTGEASVVDVSLLGAAVWTLSVDLVATAATGTEAKPHVPGSALSGTVLVGSYRTADDRWLSLNMLDQERFWEPACRALGLERLIDDPDYATTDARSVRVPELHDLFVATIGALTLDDLKARLSAEDTIWSTMASPSEVVDDPQVEANGYMPKVPDHPTARLDVRTGAVRRARARDPPARARHRRAHGRGPGRDRLRPDADRTIAERREPCCERAGSSAGRDLGGRAELPGARGRDRQPASRVPDAVHEVAAVGDRPRRAHRDPAPCRASPITRVSSRSSSAVAVGTSRSQTRSTCVAGLTIAHDVSARDHQFVTGQFSWSKSFDTFCPLGPEVVSVDEVDLDGGLTLETRVSGEVMQSSTTADLVFSVPQLVAWITQGTTLESGDVILTGTPSGVGAAHVPPRYLEDGDVVEITIEGLGTLRNPVVRNRRRRVCT